MGTQFEIMLCGDDYEHLDATAVLVIEEILRLDSALSRFDPRSEIARVNREAAERPVRVDCELFELLARCEEARQSTAGYFDVTAANKTTGNEPALILEEGPHTVKFASARVRIDLGAFAKGYALDRGREILQRYGVGCGLINGGGSSVLALHPPPDRDEVEGRRGWSVEVHHPLSSDAPPFVKLKLQNQSFSCSAVREADQQQSDVVNPLTGQPLDGNAACVVLTASATDAEVFSTALLAMGSEGARQYLSEKSNSESRAKLKVGWFEPETNFVWLPRRDD